MGETHLTIADRMDPARAAALHAAFGHDGMPPASGDPLPPLWHQIYFWDVRPPAALGPDGHPARGGIIPDLGLPRRMWAGGRLTWHAPLLAGIRAEKTTRVLNVTRKEGRTGALAFVTLRHQVRQRGTLVLTEDQDLVYRAADAPPGAPPVVSASPELREPVRFDATLLFRYSALTMNGHRIHYDADYARTAEGYAGLVVHGPLIATLLMALAERREGPLAQFAFRATAPLSLPEGAWLCAAGRDYWAEADDGRVCMIGSTED